MVILHTLAVIAQQPQPGGRRVIVGYDQAGVAVRAEVFRGIEAERGRVAEASRAAIPVPGAVRLRRILDDQQVVPGGNRHHAVEIGRLPVQMDRNDRAGAGPDGRRDGCGIDRVRVDHRPRPVDELEGDRALRAVDQHGAVVGVVAHQAPRQRRGEGIQAFSAQAVDKIRQPPDAQPLVLVIVPAQYRGRPPARPRPLHPRAAPVLRAR